MIALNTERIKSIILFSLVIMSFILTTRIWFNVSIEGLFVMPSKDKLSQAFKTTYEKESLLKPSKLVVHIGANKTLLSNNQSDKAYYDSILKGSNKIIKDLLDNKENYIETNVGIDQLDRIRDGRAVELIYKSSTQLDYIKSLLDVDKNLWNDIKEVTSIIISPAENKVYVIDQSKPVIHQFIALNMSKELEGTIDQIKAREDFSYVFLNDFNGAEYEFYSKYAIAPVSITSMPVLAVKKEVESDIKPSTEITAFFNTDDSSKIYSIRDPDGTVTFTDKDEGTVKVDTKGALEYYKYNITSKDIKYTDMNEAVSIAADYVNQHFGFKGDFYLSGIEGRPQGGRTTYLISFDYKYDGIPIITETDTDKSINKSAIEVEIVGQEVRRYKRNVGAEFSETRTVKIKSFDEILNLVQGRFDKYLNINNSESISKINDLYLAYFERNGILTPVWVADVQVESSVSDKITTYNKKYIIQAEEGQIDVILGEQ